MYDADNEHEKKFNFMKFICYLIIILNLPSIQLDLNKINLPKKGGRFLHKMALNKRHLETCYKIEFYTILC